LIGPRQAGSAAELRGSALHRCIHAEAVEGALRHREADLPRAAERLRDWGAGAIVIKNGATARSPSMARAAAGVPALRFDRVVDNQLRGQFCAGFIAATLRGSDPGIRP